MKQVNFVLYGNGAPEAKFSSKDETVYCSQASCGRKCEDVKKCIYPPKFKKYLEESFPEYDVKLSVRYQQYSDGVTDKDVLREDAELIKKHRVDFTNNFIDEVVRGNKK